MSRIALLLVSVLLISPASSSYASSFGYFGEIGPDFWSELNEDYFACSSGDLQSPVDLGKQRVYPRLKVDYDPATTGQIFNNGQSNGVRVKGQSKSHSGWLVSKPVHLRSE